MDIAEKIPTKIAGRAIRRFSHSMPSANPLGDDIGDNLKDPLLIIGFLFFGSYNALIWITRNYQSWQQRLTIKPLAAFLFVILQCFTMLAIFAVFSLLPSSWLFSSEQWATTLNTMVLGPIYLLEASWHVLSFYLFTLPASLLGADMGLPGGTYTPSIPPCDCQQVSELAPPHYTNGSIIATLVTYLAFMGTALIDGALQRKQRRQAWQAIKLNKSFLAAHQLANPTNSSLSDQLGRLYEVHAMRRNYVELATSSDPDKKMLLIFDLTTGTFETWDALEKLHPDWLERKAMQEDKPKGLQRRRAKFPRVAAPKKSYRVTNFTLPSKN